MYALVLVTVAQNITRLDNSKISCQQQVIYEDTNQNEKHATPPGIQG